MKIVVFLLLCFTSTFLFVVVKAEEEEFGTTTVLNDDPGNEIAEDDCPCVNVSSDLGSVSSRTCQLSNGDKGIKLSDVDGSGAACVPLSYGSSQCLQHDLIHNYISCSLDNVTETPVPAYCFRPWCYVDSKTCMKDSFERIYRSDHLSFDSDIDIFYSYSTCNSTADDWLEKASKDILGGISIQANIPTYMLPMMYKRDLNDAIIVTGNLGDAYYNNRIPFEGVYINFVEKLMKISNGDIANVTYTHKSKASSLVHPTSSFSAAVQDIKDGLVDMSVGPFWITGQRLKMAAFTVPIVYDKTFLAIPRPTATPPLRVQVAKILAPFSWEVWLLLGFIIVIASLLSVWFTDEADVSTNTKQKRRRSLGRIKNPLRRRKRVYARLALDSVLEKSTYFFSAGVDNDPAASLPNKFLMFGFGFFILITVSAYVANLAAFLTRNMDVVQSMEGAVAAGKIICAHPALENELQLAWPKANFYFTQLGKEFLGMIEDYDVGRCDFLAVGYEDTSMDLVFREMFCERNLAVTDSLIAEIPIAMPVRPDLASGISYWMVQAESFHELTITSEKKKYAEESQWLSSCDFQLSAEANESSDDYTKITVGMMFFPLMIFLSCTIIAVLMQAIHQYQIKKGHKSLVGRASTLDLTSGDNSVGVLESGSRSLCKRKGWFSSDRIFSKNKVEKNEDPLSSTSASKKTKEKFDSAFRTGMGFDHERDDVDDNDDDDDDNDNDDDDDDDIVKYEYKKEGRKQ